MHSTPGIDSPVIGIQTASTEYVSPVFGIPPQITSGWDRTHTTRYFTQASHLIEEEEGGGGGGVSSLAEAETIASTHCAYHRGMAVLSKRGWLVKYQYGTPANVHPSQSAL